MRFRISGQGKRYFGDGLSLWATSSPYFHDSIESDFKGFGLSLDTFVNDHGHMHRDVLFMTADGGAPVIPQEPIGCDSEYRYWEGIHDFSAMNSSGVRLSFQHGLVSVFVDPRGTGAWTACFKDAPIAPHEGWWLESDGIYFGLSAKTGDLADNHDVLSFVVTLEDEPAPASSMVDAPAQYSTGDEGLDAAISAAASREAARTALQLSDLQHELEHQLTSVRDGLKSALSKLQKQEDANAARIEALEARLSDKVQGSLNERIEQLESQIGGAIRAQLDDHILPTLHGRVDRGSTIAVAAVSVLGVVVAVLFAFAWRKYRYLKKSHLL